jgi:hypothetical protein
MAKCFACGGVVPDKATLRAAFKREAEETDDAEAPQRLAAGGEVAAAPAPKRPPFADALRARIRARSPFSRQEP